MIKTGSLTYNHFIFSILAGMIDPCILQIRHMLLDIHGIRERLSQFCTCHGKER
jgi:hypothetical protein